MNITWEQVAFMAGITWIAWITFEIAWIKGTLKGMERFGGDKNE